MPATEFSYIAFNTYKPELKDPRVRLAINMAIDKELIAKTIYGGEALPNNAQNLEGMLGFNPSSSRSSTTPRAQEAAGRRRLPVRRG